MIFTRCKLKMKKDFQDVPKSYCLFFIIVLTLSKSIFFFMLVKIKKINQYKILLRLIKNIKTQIKASQFALCCLSV